MTDVEASAPTKRKSVSNKQGNKGSPKKFAPDRKKPQQAVNQAQTLKQPNSNLDDDVFKKPLAPVKKPIKKNKKKTEIDSLKKLKPFKGTSEIKENVSARKQIKKAKTEKKVKTEKTLKAERKEKTEKKVKTENTAEDEKEQRKPRKKGQFYRLTLQVRSGEKVLTTIEQKIKAIRDRSDLSKTAKKKLKYLIKLKRVAAGESPQAPQERTSTSSETSKRHGKKHKAKQAKESSEPIKPNLAKINKKEKKTKVLSQVIATPNVVNINGKANQKGKLGNKKLAQEVKLEPKVEDNSDDESGAEEEDDESETIKLEPKLEDNSDDESGAEEEDDESEDENSEEEDEVEGENSDESGEEGSEEQIPRQEEESDSGVAVPKKKRKRENSEKDIKNQRPVNLDELKKNNLLGKNQKRFVLFVGNIPYDTVKLDLVEHFKKCGEIKHIRIPTEKKSSKPRGFGYVEVGDEQTYQKCLSMHHSFLKGRRINVMYTQGGKKKGDDKKKEIKAKNFKLHAMRKQGQLAGSKKDAQKRSTRRAKQRMAKGKQESHD